MLAQRLDETFLEIRMIEHRQLIEDRRHRLARRLGQRIAAAVVVRQPVVDDRLRHCLTAVATHRPPLVVDDDGQINIVGDRQAAVVTGRFGHKQKRRRSAF